MSNIRQHKVELSMLAEIDVAEIEQHVPVPVVQVAREVSRQIIRYAREQSLGYCPAITYFEDGAGIDKASLDALYSVSWIASQQVQSIVTNKLRPLYTNLKIKRLQNLAFMLPKLRLRDKDIEEKLTHFLVPNRFMLELQLGVMQKHDIKDAIIKFVSKQAVHNLKNNFKRIEITAAYVCDD